MLDVAVVGAGLGGLSAAVHLAAAGHRVTLLEKGDAPGGKASRVDVDGYSFDTGPSLVTMPEVLEDLFAAAGERRADHLPMERLPLQCRYFFPDGARIDFLDDRAATLAQIARHEPEDVRRWERLLDDTARMYEVVGRPFLEHPYEGFGSFGRVVTGDPLEALKWGALQGMLGDMARKSLRSERMRWVMHRFATYAGGGPDRTPASFATIVHVETAGGAWYPQGGIYGLVRAVEALALRQGVRIEYGTPVEQLLVSGSRISGLVAGGRERRFDVVVCNADPVYAAEKLLEPAVVRRAGLDGHRKQELGLSGFVLLLGVRGRLDQLAHHNVAFPPQYAPEFDDLFRQQRMPQQPTVYLCVPSRTDASRAPAGCESVFVLVNAPATAHRDDWEALRPAAVERTKAALRRIIPDLDARIAVERTLTPQDLLVRYNAPGGSIYGVSPHGRLSPFHRPQARVRDVQGLYFAGGGTHPGGGIPLVIRSGRFAAQMVAQDYGHAAGRRAS